MDEPRRPGDEIELPGEVADDGPSPDDVVIGDRIVREGPVADSAVADVPLTRADSGDLGTIDWRRWRLYGCAVGFLGLVALLVLGANILRNTVWLGYGATHQRVVAALGEASPPERLRTIRNLDAFTSRLRAMDEPYGLMGEFQRRAGEALADGRLEPSELEDLNEFLEQADGTGAP
jgi:hypothetical protein